MCGRVVQKGDPSTYGGMLKVDFTKGMPNAAAHYNGAPGQDFLVARLDPESGTPTLGLLRWGLIPSWAEDRKIAWKLINARAESLARTPAFRKAYERRRCLLPVDGFYEWRKVGREKQPFVIGMADGAPFTLAALWENWKDPVSGEWQRTFTVITTQANALLARLHDRMPVIVPPESRERWLREADPSDLLVPYPAELMTLWPVSQKVNSPKNDTPDLLDRIEGVDLPGTDDIPRANEGGPQGEPANPD